MKWIDFKAGVRDFWNEFQRVKFGLFGLILLFIFFLAILINPYIVPFPEASSRWRDITYWEDNPVSAPPVWVNWFSSTNYQELFLSTNIPMIFLLWILYSIVILKGHR
jgi:peptide/nickel transport system permease protein